MSSLSDLPGMASPKGTDASRRYRVILWTYTLTFVAALAALIASQRGAISPDLKPFAFLGLLFAGAGAVVAFRQGAAAHAAERAREERQVMLVIMAGELNKQDDAALERISRQRGMAGEAATWILAERRRKQQASAPPSMGDGLT